MRKAAAVSGGSYVVIFEDGEHGEPALGYRDAAGAFVQRPMPAEHPHHPGRRSESVFIPNANAWRAMASSPR